MLPSLMLVLRSSFTVFLPFQILGGFVLALLLAPIFLIGVPIVLGLGIPVFLLAVGVLVLFVVGGTFCLLGSLIFGWC